MELTDDEKDSSKSPKRTANLRHNRTASDIQQSQRKDSSGSTNGLKAVNTVTGAIQNFFKWSSPLAKENKARSFDSINTVSSRDDTVIQKDSLTMEKRRSSGIITSRLSTGSTSKEGSPDTSSYRYDKEPSSPSKRAASPGITFSASGVDGVSDTGGATGSPVRGGTPSRKSTDSSDSQKGFEQMDLGGKSFETSLNNILNKCSETTLDGTTDGKDDPKKSDRKKKSTPWYSILSPTYKSRSEDFKRQFKDIPTDERLICDYSCALQKEILVHGRMFVTQNWICFYANIFRWETIVTIPTKDILAITKEKTARVIPNAIQVSTEKDKYFFTSFTARDKTFMMLFRLWQNALMEQPMLPQELWHWVHSCYGDELGLTSSDDDYVQPPNLGESKDSVSKDASLIDKGDSSEMIASASLPNNIDEEGDSTQADISLDDSNSVPVVDKDNDPTDFSDTTEDGVSEGEIVCSEHDHFTKLAHNEVYQIPLEKLFELLFTDSEFFRNFVEKARKYSDVTVTPWGDIEDEHIGRVREVKYTIPLNAPFGPKSSNTIEKHMCYKSSQPGQMYLIDAECTPLGIPYADAFYVMNRYCLTRVSKEKCRLRVTSEVKYRKSVWGVVKNMIERNSVQGVLDYFQCLGIHLRRESEKQQSLQGLPAAAKRKKRKRRTHGIRVGGAVVDLPATARQLSRSHQKSEKLVAPPTPVRNAIAAQKEERLLRMNADTLVRIICFILVLLVMFNALLFYKLWSLETMANVLYLPNSEDAIHSFTKHPPKSHEEWVQLLSHQQQLHDAEMNKWRDLLGASIAMVDQMKQTLINLKDHIESRTVRYQTEQHCDKEKENCEEFKKPNS